MQSDTGEGGMSIAIVHNHCMPYRRFLFAALAERFEIDFFFFNQPREGIPPVCRAQVLRGFRVPLASAYSVVPRLGAALRERRYRLIIGSDLGAYITAVAFNVARAARTPFVPWIEEWDTIRHPRRFLRRPFEQRLLRGSAAAIVPGVKHADYLRRLGVPKEKIRRVPNALDYAPAAPDTTHPLYRRLAPLRGDPALVCAIGRHVDAKGHGQLLRAQGLLEQVERNGGAAAPHLVLAGNGPLLGAHKTLAAQLGLRKLVLVESFVNETEKAILYDLCDVFALASTRKRAFEAWGLVCNEALAYGKPMVVTTAVGAAGEVVREGINGFIVADKDIAALALALGRLTGEPALRARCAQGSLGLRAEYTPQVMIDAFSEVLATCAAP